MNVRGWRLAENPRRVSFTVYGAAQPKGSMQAFVVPGGVRPRAVVTERQNSSSRTWQRLIAGEAQRHAPVDGPLDGPLVVDLVFYLPRPASEPKSVLTLPDRKPDLDKLTRGFMDALRRVIIADDARVVRFARLCKLYSARPRVEVAVWQATADDLPPLEEAAAEIAGRRG